MDNKNALKAVDSVFTDLLAKAKPKDKYLTIKELHYEFILKSCFRQLVSGDTIAVRLKNTLDRTAEAEVQSL